MYTFVSGLSSQPVVSHWGAVQTVSTRGSVQDDRPAIAAPGRWKKEQFFTTDGYQKSSYVFSVLNFELLELEQNYRYSKLIHPPQWQSNCYGGQGNLKFKTDFSICVYLRTSVVNLILFFCYRISPESRHLQHTNLLFSLGHSQIQFWL